MRESERNELLRGVDWRFLLHRQGTPRALIRASGTPARAAELVSDPADGASGDAELVVLARPTAARLAAAHQALAPGGELYCQWQLPRRADRATHALAQAGFTDITLLWPWPPPAVRSPQFWLPVDSPDALQGFMSLRPAPRSRLNAAARAVWPWTARYGLLAPIAAIARRPGSTNPTPDHGDELDALLAGNAGAGLRRANRQSWVLLTGGRRSVNKVVGLPFRAGQRAPELVVKFARVPEADAALHREAEILRLLEANAAPALGVPRMLAVGRRAGRVALAQSAVRGVPLTAQLRADTFPDLAARVTRWLVGLAGAPAAELDRERQSRLVREAMEEFERGFSGALDESLIGAVRARLECLGPVPLVCEHRDCAPWNVVITDAGTPTLLDWESAEPQGLPALDLVYFIANAAFLLDGSLESGRTRETYARLLDAGSPIGQVAAACLEEYRSRMSFPARELPRLRLLCWVVHARSEYARAVADAAGSPSVKMLRQSVFLGLIEEELQRAE